MADEEINRAIHNWLGKCWHESSGVGSLRDGGYYCKKCGDSNSLAPFPPEWDDDGNPDYLQPAAAIALLDAVRAKDKDCRVRLQMLKDGWAVWIFSVGDVLAEASADTLPATIAKAAVALIESEETK